MDQVFLSYAWADDDFPPKWVSRFHEDLESRLSSYAGRPIRVWKDNVDRKGNNLDQEIMDALDASDFLIALSSPTYYNSFYCTLEREYFIRKNSERYEVAPQAIVDLIFRVTKVKNGTEVIPDELKPQFIHKFYKKVERRNEWRELERRNEYRKLINSLSADIFQALEKGPRAILKKDDAKPTIYINIPSSDVFRYRNQLKSELSRSGFSILPDKWISAETENAQEMIREDLQSSLFSIHLFGESYGEELPDEARTIQEMQFDVATSLTNQPHYVIGWINGEASDFEEKQKQFVDSLWQKDFVENVDIMGNSFEDLKMAVHEYIDENKLR